MKKIVTRCVPEILLQAFSDPTGAKAQASQHATTVKQRGGSILMLEPAAV